MSWGEPQPSQPPQNFGFGGPPGHPQPDPAGYGGPPPRKGNGVLIGIVVGALVVVGGGVTAALLFTGKHDAAAALRAPSSVNGLTELTGTTAGKAVTAVRQSLTAEAAEYPDPVLAAYDDHGGSGVTTILVDEPMDKLSTADQAQLASLGSASDVVASIMSGAGVQDPRNETTSAADGALSCGTKDEDGTGVTICVWYDKTTFGSLQYLDGTSPAVAAPTADAVRAAAEG